MPDKSTLLIVEHLAAVLIKKNKRLAVAESCTGGWIAKILTDLAGSSAWFERGFVTYSNKAKEEMLGVNTATIATYGAVSEQTVNEMALGALQHSHAQYSLSVSGVAGPGGGTKDKPVGLVCFAWAGAGEIILSEQQNLSGDRNAIREQAVVYALTTLLRLL